MKKNYFTVITGAKVVLVSYKKEHVAKYHEWMKDVELRRLTGSDPLTLYEEYKMQASWMNDPKKCTFIVLDKNIYTETRDEIESMVGDTNLFFNDQDDPTVAEAEIMIAEESARRKKMGWEAMLLMLHYGITDLKIKKYVVKIGDDNEKSLSLFRKIGFEFESHSDVFLQVTMTKEVCPAFKHWLEMNLNFIKLKNCDIRIIAAIATQRRAQIQARKEKEKKEKLAKEKEAAEKKEEAPKV